ncbi:ABC-type transport auxiliary lipoprotein family protein [Phenylobacterium deserti]|uniref:ABC transporter n=1 Tax=Phenylobacterium deserti TaxID=1914756 RepID=A0A328ADX8_9CAUL|nr:ABC-type transport auxiliary lipoprotein family protein [Phenylobacterium deserti]RAK52860.1 ABC transporter [Phenylobacterium deserti]
MSPTLSRPAALLRVAAAAGMALALSGCISLLPKSKPSLLYRFGQTPVAAASTPAPAASAGAQRSVGVFRAMGLFQREAASDRMLTVTGSRTAYIAGARWVAPAQNLFDEAVLRAFDDASGQVRLVSRGEQVRSAYALRLDVRNFEAHYENGPEAAPTVLVRVRALMTRNTDSAVMGEQIFEARVPAAENRVGAIVDAYDQALSQVLGQLVGWTNQTARPVAA